MRLFPDTPLPSSQAARHRTLAQRVADAHRALGDASLMAFVSGSTVENLLDERSDVDMSVVLGELPPGDRLRAACREAGGGEWTWALGDAAGGSFVVSFRIEGTEVQVAYATHAAFAAQLDELLLRHNPDTPIHKLAEGVLKAVPLADADALRRWQVQLGSFPEALREAMLRHALKTPTHWRAAAQIIHRDTPLWCRDLQVDACYRLLQMLCALNRRYFTRFQVKRLHKLAGQLRIAPPQLAERMEALLNAEPRAAFDALHALEAEVLALAEQHLPLPEVLAARERLALYRPDAPPPSEGKATG